MATGKHKITALVLSGCLGMGYFFSVWGQDAPILPSSNNIPPITEQTVAPANNSEPTIAGLSHISRAPQILVIPTEANEKNVTVDNVLSGSVGVLVLNPYELSAQPDASQPVPVDYHAFHNFNALAMFDQYHNGFIDRSDKIFSHLRLLIFDGSPDHVRVVPLEQMGIVAIFLKTPSKDDLAEHPDSEFLSAHTHADVVFADGSRRQIVQLSLTPGTPG